MGQRFKMFEWEAMIHPKEGGNDYHAAGTATAADLEDAKKLLEEWLGKRSAVTTDYHITPREEKACTG